MTEMSGKRIVLAAGVYRAVVVLDSSTRSGGDISVLVLVDSAAHALHLWQPI